MYSPESGNCHPHSQTSYGAGIVSLQAATVGFVCSLVIVRLANLIFVHGQKGEPMSDLISRQAAIDALYHVDEYNSRSVEAIRNLPSAEPQIIRCKDCKHWIPYDWMFSEEWQSQNIDDYPEDDIGCDCCDMAMKANDFCSRAERRTE